jgi:hypothetical protein
MTDCKHCQRPTANAKGVCRDCLRLVELVPKLDEVSLCTLISQAPAWVLKLLESAFGFAGCDCPLVTRKWEYMPTEDSHSEKCFLDLYEPCPHVAVEEGRWHLPESAYEMLLERLEPLWVSVDRRGRIDVHDGYGELPPPQRALHTTDTSARIGPLAERHRQGRGLHHPDDSPAVTPADDRAVRTVSRRESGNGTPTSGELVASGDPVHG